MRSTFFGLETARRALMAQQMGLDTTAHNIANANTPGYSRQVVQHTATTPYPTPSWNAPGTVGQIGTGVEVTAIQRMRDAFLDSQIRQETSTQGRWETQSEYLQQIELIYNEPSESGLRTAIDDFWESLQDLSINPESGSVRTVVLSKGQALADMINHTYTQLKELRDSVNSDISAKVSEVNTYAARIASLNRQIVEATAVGDHPNDLMDQRDQLITELSKIVDVSVITDTTNTTTISIGGVPLVDWDRARQLEVRDDNGDSISELYWQGTTNAVQLKDGTLQGMFEVRDNLLAGHLDAIENISDTLITQFNPAHQAGYGLNGETGLNFFEYSPEPLLRVAVTEDQIAAASSWADVNGDGINDSVGDGSNAKAMSDILNGKLTITDKDTGVVVATDTTIRDYFNGVVAELGIGTQHAMQMAENQNVLVNSLQDRIEGVSGVSLDEEMVNMMKFQHAYNAAARVMTSLDEIYDTIINRMGLVGR